MREGIHDVVAPRKHIVDSPSGCPSEVYRDGLMLRYVLSATTVEPASETAPYIPAPTVRHRRYSLLTERVSDAARFTPARPSFHPG